MNAIKWLAILFAVLMIATCFLPWAHYNSINETFTGFRVSKFGNGTYYGRAGIPISVLSALIFVLVFVEKKWAGRIAVFFAAVLFAYSIRTYLVFTGSLFEGEVVKHAGMYFLVPVSALLLLFTALSAAKSAYAKK